MTFHPVAWMVWTLSAMIIAQSTSNPMLLAVGIAAMLYTAVTLSPRTGPLRMMLIVGAFAIVVRVILFGLAGHPGGTTLVTIPEIRLPVLLGGFRLGGAITAQVLAESAAEGLRLAAVLVCFGVFLSIVEPARVLRLVPRYLFEAGLIVAIGVTFVPSLAQSARDVREAQRLRGARARGLRAAAALALPVLSSAMERSALIAESMESRGYGTLRRTRYRRDAIRAHDVLVMSVAAAAAILAMLTRNSAAWSAWPQITVPQMPALALIGVALLAAPVAVHRARSASLRARSAEGSAEAEALA